MEGEKPSPAIVTVNRTSVILSIGALAFCGLLPAALGGLFYVSLGFTAPSGQFHTNGTFVRPTSQGLEIFGFSLSPLLLSSIASTWIGDISGLVMALLSYHLASRWLHASNDQPISLPSSRQLILVMNMIVSASPMALWDFLKFLIWQPPSEIILKQYFRHHSPSHKRSRESITRLLLCAASGLATVLAISFGIKIVDIVLHERMVSTVLMYNTSTNFDGHAFVSPDCAALAVDACPVWPRASVARGGGGNESSLFFVHEVPYGDRQDSMSFLGPPGNANSPAFSAAGPTIAVGAVCSIGRLACINPLDNGTMQYPIGSSQCNSSVYPNGWGSYTDSWDDRPQIYTLDAQDIEPDNSTVKNPSNSLGTIANPVTIMGLLTFDDYSNIMYNQTIEDYDPPYISWDFPITGQMFGTVVPNTLAFAFSCNISVYDASYTLSAGAISIDYSSLSRANASTTLSVTSSITWLYHASDYMNSLPYPNTPRYLDQLVASDVTRAGNLYGNSTARFSAALAQSFSNRLIGWSAGAISMTPLEGNLTLPLLAIQIPVASSIAFVMLNVVYAVGVFVLALSCAFMAFYSYTPQDPPINFEEGEALFSAGLSPTNGDTGFLERAQAQDGRHTISDLQMAQHRISNPAALVDELALRNKEIVQLHSRIDEQYNPSCRVSIPSLNSNRRTSWQPGHRRNESSQSQASIADSQRLLVSPSLPLEELEDMHFAIRRGTDGILRMVTT